MTKNLFLTLACCLGALFATPGCLTAAVEYGFEDIGTLQTHSSRPIALNNQGEILGVYNLDGSTGEEHFFLRDKEGNFSELPTTVEGIGSIEWQYLTNNGTAYAARPRPAGYTTLFMWDRENGAINLGDLPGHNIVAINDAGQVLIKNVIENVHGESFSYPVIWDNGELTKLEGLEGDGGLPSEEAYGLDLNNHGDVVGYSVVSLIYKNALYKQTHATKWVNGQPIDLHKTVPKTDHTVATHINDLGEALVGRYLVDESGNAVLINDMHFKGNDVGVSDTNYLYTNSRVINKNSKTVFVVGLITNMMTEDPDSIWLLAARIVDVNDHGEIIAAGETIYGEQHALFIYPVKAD